MGEVRCEKSWLPPGQCAHCRRDDDSQVEPLGTPTPRGDRLAPADVWVHRYRVALIPTRCCICLDVAEGGDPIGVTRSGRAVCVDCANTLDNQ